MLYNSSKVHGSLSFEWGARSKYFPERINWEISEWIAIDLYNKVSYHKKNLKKQKKKETDRVNCGLRGIRIRSEKRAITNIFMIS